MKELSAFPRVALGILPTPLYRLENISSLLKKNVYIKRDDMTGVSLGGNKVRKLEYLLGDAKAKGADYVLTTGGAQSNHAMLTAACANRLGMGSVLVLKKRGVWEKKGNQVLNALLGTEVRFVDSDSYDDVYAEMNAVSDALRAQGHVPYLIPVGGSVPLGSLGYVNCAREIAAQCAEQDLRLDHIVCCTGSGGTHAGLALGAHIYLPGVPVTGMDVDGDDFTRIVSSLMNDTAALLEYDPRFTPDDVRLRRMAGAGYAIPSPAGNDAMRLMARREGLILDPVYTGKTFAGLLETAREGGFDGAENILFLHSGGAGGVFAIDVP